MSKYLSNAIERGETILKGWSDELDENHRLYGVGYSETRFDLSKVEALLGEYEELVRNLKKVNENLKDNDFLFKKASENFDEIDLSILESAERLDVESWADTAEAEEITEEEAESWADAAEAEAEKRWEAARKYSEDHRDPYEQDGHSWRN